MRPHLREFFDLCARTLVCPEPIVEIGAVQVVGEEAIADLRALFPEKAFIGCDMQSGTGVDRVEDIHKLSFRSGEVGTHGYPNDYWRFTAEAFRALAPSFHWRPFFSVAHASFLTPFAASQQRTNMISRQSKRSLVTVRHQDDGAADYRRACGANHPPFMTKLVPAKSTPSEEISAGFDNLAQPGWCLLTGQWIAGWSALENGCEVEILAGDTVAHHVRLNRA